MVCTYAHKKEEKERCAFTGSDGSTDLSPVLRLPTCTQTKSMDLTWRTSTSEQIRHWSNQKGPYFINKPETFSHFQKSSQSCLVIDYNCFADIT